MRFYKFSHRIEDDFQKWGYFNLHCCNVCVLVSTAYRFNPGDGIIHFHLPLAEQKATKVDELALGFITTQADAILARINSADSNDYIQLELVRHCCLFYIHLLVK